MTDSGIAIHPALGGMCLKESKFHVKVVIEIALSAIKQTSGNKISILQK